MGTPDSVLNLPSDVRMLDVVRRGLETADDVCIAVSFTRCSGLGLLIDPLREVTERGGSVRFLTSTYQAVTQPEALEALQGLPLVEARVQSGPVGFHTKFWWFQGRGGGECWAGSSNLSRGGLATNLEWNLRNVQPALMASTRLQFDELWARPDVFELNQTLIDRYREVYQAKATPNAVGAVLVADSFGSGPVEPNPAQVEALANLAALRGRGERRAAVIAATGLGKTWLAAFDVLQSGARTVLYVSHRLEHLLQAERCFRLLFPRRSIGVVGGGRDEAEAEMVFATVASLRHRSTLRSKAFDYLIIDEFHHAEADGYEVLRPLRERAFLLGITATPERQDGRDVLEWCDWNVAYEIRMPEAIDRGWLLPFHYFGIADESVDFASFPWRQIDRIEDLLSVEARAAHVLRHALERGFDGPKRATIGFCAGTRHARFMARAFRSWGQSAVAVLGDQPVLERRELYDRLSDPRDPLQWIFVSDILNEGVDIPAINSLLFLRPTESATLFLQQLGRGLRLCPGTEVLTVLDFVGHHRTAWLTLNTLDAPGGGGRRTELAEGVVIKPPSGCEVVLQRRTREILSKVKRFTSKKAACAEAYQRVRAELGRSPLPLDLWNRRDVPDLSEFRAAYGTWVDCQRANGDEPAWSRGITEDHIVFSFLRIIEANWQAQRVSPYALLWGLSARPEAPEAGYDDFFERWGQWRVEKSALNGSKTWETLRQKLGDLLSGDGLAPPIRAALGAHLLREIEGRLLYTVNGDHQERHGGVLRSPADLHLFARYNRPDIVRHFGSHYDPARHNTGMLWFGEEGAIITKLDTSGAKAAHQYANRLLGAQGFLWTSQNRMGTDNEPGRRVIEHEARGLRLHLFVQPRSHEPACYLGKGRVARVEGSRPMRVQLELYRPVPQDVLAELLGSD